MFCFDCDQKVFNVSGVEIGGQPGELPTVLVGSIFFRGHRLVHDAERGVFDRSKARDLLHREGEWSLTTSVPRMIDVIGESPRALARFVEFVAEETQGPILLDSPSWEVRVGALRSVAALGLVDRIVYNSLDVNYHPEELETIASCGVKSAVVLVFDTSKLRPEDRLGLLVGDGSRPGLLEVAKSAGIENVLVDCGTLDVPTISWTARAIWQVKNRFGLPAGCAPANALYQWNKMRTRGSPAFEAAASAVCALPQTYGANFLFYGSLANAPWAYSACATVDAMMAYGAKLDGMRPRSRTHPLFSIFVD